MLVWLILPFCDFCGFRSVAVNSVYKLQFFLHFFTFISGKIGLVRSEELVTQLMKAKFVVCSLLLSFNVNCIIVK